MDVCHENKLAVCKVIVRNFRRDGSRPTAYGVQALFANHFMLPDKHVFGTYFLHTNVKTLDEKTTWDYYNLISEIECTNRQTRPTSTSGPSTKEEYPSVHDNLLASRCDNP